MIMMMHYSNIRRGGAIIKLETQNAHSASRRAPPPTPPRNLISVFINTQIK
jgi:hypothetical protein